MPLGALRNNWTGDQAIAVVEFLDELNAMIWSAHELKMLDAWHERIESNDESEEDDQMPPDAVYVGTKNPPSLDDDFPF